ARWLSEISAATVGRAPAPLSLAGSTGSRAVMATSTTGAPPSCFSTSSTEEKAPSGATEAGIRTSVSLPASSLSPYFSAPDATTTGTPTGGAAAAGVESAGLAVVAGIHT